MVIFQCPIGIHLLWDGQDLLSDACTGYGNWKSTPWLDFKDTKVWVTLIFQNSLSPAPLSDVPACSLMVLYPRAPKQPICRVHKQVASSLLITLEKLHHQTSGCHRNSQTALRELACANSVAAFSVSGSLKSCVTIVSGIANEFTPCAAKVVNCSTLLMLATSSRISLFTPLIIFCDP